MDKSKITFHVRYGQDEYYLETFNAEYPNLMELLKDKIYPDGFGECGGMGRCGTCLVHIPPESEIALFRVGNESTTLSKMNCDDFYARLCCQIPVDNTLQNMTISIVADY
jgi:2Fe-2S ferredoxin